MAGAEDFNGDQSINEEQTRAGEQTVNGEQNRNGEQNMNGDEKMDEGLEHDEGGPLRLIKTLTGQYAFLWSVCLALRRSLANAICTNSSSAHPRFIHLLVLSVIHGNVYSPILSCVHTVMVHPSIHPFRHLSVRPSSHSFVDLIYCGLVVNMSVHAFFHASIHSFVHPSVLSFASWLLHSCNLQVVQLFILPRVGPAVWVSIYIEETVPACEQEACYALLLTFTDLLWHPITWPNRSFPRLWIKRRSHCMKASWYTSIIPGSQFWYMRSIKVLL